MTYRNNKNQFHKDCYIDIQGKFDYVSVSRNQLKNTKKFATLIISKHYGCAVKYAHQNDK